MKSDVHTMSGVCCGIFLAALIVSILSGNVLSALGWGCAVSWSFIYLLKGT